MKPDRTNYQIWLTDYFDGNLSAMQEAILFAFLEENPDLKEEMNDLLTLRLEPGQIIFAGRDDLKKNPSELTDEQFGMLCIAVVEGDISDEAHGELNQVVSSDPERARSLELFMKTRLSAPDVKFKHKNSLKKQTAANRILKYALIPLSAAAAVILFIYILRAPVQQIPAGNISRITDTPSVGSEVIKSITRSSNIAVVTVSPKVKENPVQITTPPTGNKLIPDTAEPAITRAEVPLPAEADAEIPVELPEYRLASLTVADVPGDQADEPEPGPFAFVSKFFREKISKNDKEEKGPLKAYEIADAGISGLNKLFGWDMSLDKKRNDKGEVTAVHFSSKILRFNAPVKKGL
jgi:hypothetical protein